MSERDGLGPKRRPVIALVFRVLDPEVCSAVPIGTHFLWHGYTRHAAHLAMRSPILNRVMKMAAHGSAQIVAADGQFKYVAA